MLKGEEWLSAIGCAKYTAISCAKYSIRNGIWYSWHGQYHTIGAQQFAWDAELYTALAQGIAVPLELLSCEMPMPKYYYS